MFSTERFKAARKAAQQALRAARAAHAEATARLEKHEALRGTMPATDHMTGRQRIKAEAIASIREAAQAVPDGELAALAGELELPAILKRARSLPPLDKDYHDALARDTREMHQLLLRRELRDAAANSTPAEIAHDVASIAASFGPNGPDGATLERFAVLNDHVRRHGSGNEWNDAKRELSIATSRLSDTWKHRATLIEDVEFAATALRATAAYEGALDQPRDRWPAEALMADRGLIDRQQQAA